MSLPRRAAVSAPILAVAAALFLSGCTSLATAQTPHEKGSVVSESAPPAVHADGARTDLPVSTYSTVVEAPLIDGFAASTGEVARPSTESITVYDSASGNPMALLPATETVPVIGRSTGWIRVMLPSRRGVPGESPLRATVNGSTGWVKSADVTIEKAGVRLRLSKAEQRLDVLTLAGDRAITSFPATVGSEVPLGPTYVASGFGTAGCGVAPIKLNFQSETTATYRGLPFSPILIFGPAPECDYTAQDRADLVPRIIQISPEGAKALIDLAMPGTFVDVVLSSGSSSAAPAISSASYRMVPLS